jgi:hypothetical protein
MSARLLPPRPAGRTRSMWGLVPGCTSSTRSFARRMDAVERRSEVTLHDIECGPERRRPSHQHIIVAGAKRCGRGDADQFAEAPPHAVAFHGIADLLGDREPNPRRSGLGTPVRLEDEGARRRACASCGSLGGGPKVTPAFQPLHETDIRIVLNRNGDPRPDRAALSAQALNFFRPRARRAAKTLRPPLLAMRVRKPWRRLRTNLLG